MAESSVDPGILNAALSSLAGEFTAGGASRMRRMDQLAADSASMWAVALTSPTVSSALGFRTAAESGSSRTRAETNGPEGTNAMGATTPK